MKRTWLLLLLLLPAAAGQSDAIEDASLSAHHLPVFTSFDGGYQGYSCYGGMWSNIDEYSFRYREAEESSQCSERRASFQIPSEAETVVVKFMGNRELVHRYQSSPIFEVVQEIRLYTGANNPDPVERWAYFQPDEDRQLETVEREHEFSLQAFSNQSTVYVGIYIEELDGLEGAEQSVGELIETGVPQGATGVPGQSIVAGFQNFDIHFPDLPASVDQTVRHDGVKAEYELLTSEIEVPLEPKNGMEYSAHLLIHSDWTIESVVGPNGEVPLEQLALSNSEMGLMLEIPIGVVQEHGEGTYTIYAVGQHKIQTNAIMFISVLGLAFTPVIAGVVAVRGATTIWNQARGANLSSIKTMQGLLLVLGGVYVGIIFWVFAGPGWRMAVAWPLLPEAAVVHAVLLMISVVFLILGLRWRRILHYAVKVDLAEKQGILEELQRSNRELEQFAYVASHDLQEPLRMVSSYTDLLERRYAGRFGEEGDQYIQFAREGSQRMAQLINDLLQFSRISTHGAAFQEVDLSLVMNDVRKNLEILLEDTGGTLHVGRMPVIDGDRTQLLRLMQNLVHNGLKFRDPERKPVVKVSAAKDGAYWVLRIADNGIGINAKYFDKIFVIFQRLHSRAQYDGTGLGLALVKRIAERHGGTIWVTSKEGKGTIFHVRLPEEQAGGNVQ